MSGMEFFIILEGTAEVVHEGKVTARLQAGDFFGEVAVLDGGPRTASVRATERLRCLGLPNGSFRQVLLDYPLMAVNLLPQVIRRFRAVMTTASSENA
jgi:CRP-like cAMP-binding protein